MKKKQYLCIDLKSFYASVECVERGLDPLTTNLVVADESRTEKTICLAVSPSLKAYGIPGRARLFEVVQSVKNINSRRRRALAGGEFEGASYDDTELKENAAKELSYIAAPPRMALYIKYSTVIYDIYLKYVAPEDILVYSIDEVFMDITDYLKVRNMSAHRFAMTVIRDVLGKTGITATAGIGTNMYLAKVAMDIDAKHTKPDADGVRISELDEMSYRRRLWTHTPLTDFWRVGRGYSKKLEKYGLYTMGDIARCSLGGKNDYYNEDLLYKLFGINAELLIDHAWGWEPCTIADAKSFRPQNRSISQGQVLHCPYNFEKGRLIVKEMADMLVLDLVDKHFVTDQIVLTVGYDIANLADSEIRSRYKGEVTTDYYGRKVPKHAHGTQNLGKFTSSTKLIMDAVCGLYDSIVDRDLLVRRMYIVAGHVRDETAEDEKKPFEQMDMFTDYDELDREREEEKAGREKEKRLQQTVINIKKQFGKNAVIRGMNLEEGATMQSRNRQIGGHKM